MDLQEFRSHFVSQLHYWESVLKNKSPPELIHNKICEYIRSLKIGIRKIDIASRKNIEEDVEIENFLKNIRFNEWNFLMNLAERYTK